MSDNEQEKCIYCRATVPANSEGDHVIPAALGEFRYARNFHGICRACNSRISPAEEQLMRCGPAWLFRRQATPTSRRSRGRCRISNAGAGGAPPPKVWAHLPDHKQAVSLEGPDSGVVPFDHLVVYGEDERRHVVRLDPGMSAEALRKAVNRLAIETITKTTMHVDKDRVDGYIILTSEAWPESSYEMKPDLEAGVHRVPIEIEFKVTVLHFRAIAKIAFHYYLTQSWWSLGDEDHFAAIRHFIMHGGGKDDVDSIFTSNDMFHFPESPKNMVPALWHHVLAAAEMDCEVFAMVCLFYGPHFQGDRYMLRIGKMPGRFVMPGIVLPKSSWAHGLNYYPPGEMGRYAGEMKPMALTKMRA